MKRVEWARDAAVALGLVVLHEAMKHALSDGALVAALFTPGGAHSFLTLLAGLLMLVVRFTLLVALPGSIGGALAAAAVSAATRRLRRSRVEPGLL